MGHPVSYRAKLLRLFKKNVTWKSIFTTFVIVVIPGAGLGAGLWFAYKKFRKKQAIANDNGKVPL